MILVDTSIWIEHFRNGIGGLETLIGLGQALNHPFVTGELAVGDPRQWSPVVALVRALPSARQATEDQFLQLIRDEALGGSGLGFVDVHLLASCGLAPGTRLWTQDRRLARHASALNVGWEP